MYHIAFYIMYGVVCILYYVLCLMYHALCAMDYVICIVYYVRVLILCVFWCHTETLICSLLYHGQCACMQ